jgi:hypothetical protein
LTGTTIEDSELQAAAINAKPAGRRAMLAGAIVPTLMRLALPTITVTDSAGRHHRLTSAARSRREQGWAPEHSHTPLSRKTPFPGGGDLPKPYYDAVIRTASWTVRRGRPRPVMHVPR